MKPSDSNSFDSLISFQKECFCDPVVASKLQKLEQGVLGLLKTLWTFHTRIFTNELNERARHWNDKICDLLVDSSKHFDLYYQFIDKLNDGIEFINSCCESNAFQAHSNLVAMKASFMDSLAV